MSKVINFPSLTPQPITQRKGRPRKASGKALPLALQARSHKSVDLGALLMPNPNKTFAIGIDHGKIQDSCIGANCLLLVETERQAKSGEVVIARSGEYIYAEAYDALKLGAEVLGVVLHVIHKDYKTA